MGAQSALEGQSFSNNVFKNAAAAVAGFVGVPTLDGFQKQVARNQIEDAAQTICAVYARSAKDPKRHGEVLKGIETSLSALADRNGHGCVMQIAEAILDVCVEKGLPKGKITSIVERIKENEEKRGDMDGRNSEWAVSSYARFIDKHKSSSSSRPSAVRSKPMSASVLAFATTK